MIRLSLLLLFLAATSGYAASHCPCENGGDCVYGSSGFKYCKCQKGYGGRYCGELLECSNYLPCQNGGRCVNSHGRNQCLCLNGWTGPDCSVNIDDCALNPCANGGKCHDGIGSFSCQCDKGWTGLLCQLRDGCASNPCHASATCYANPSNGSAICACPKGYKGEDCSIDINECFESGSPCEHGGVCVNTEGSFRCDCAVGFSGSRCEININECASNPCLNEATCLDEIGGYRCICMPGYTGTQCETDIDECVDKPCLNNGVCTNLINGYRCLCPNGYNGTRCEINENECDPNPCVNGFCIDGIAQYKCKCNPGWEGHNCEININECLNHSCVNGYCIDGINSYSCVCQAGFTGPHCEININDCAPDSCYHGGICHDLVNGFKCECPLGTSGIRCEYNTNECFSNPCRNGMCHDKINGYECECKPGFTGLNCEIDIDECASNPCANGGKCHDLPNGFRCTCPKGYFDSRCLSDVNECDPNPCMNGGHCEDDVNKFICHCLSGFSGTRCELEVDACASSPCQHNGQCLNYMGNYKCVCPPEFTGKSCEINISDCNASIFGDCLLGYTVNPWINCSQSTFCWKAFSDGVCNEVCNNKECLFDGMDCLYKQRNAGPNNQYIVDKNAQSNQDIRLNGKRRQCDPEFDSYCQRNYQNGYCDQGCNNEQCGWDGLDCLEVNQRNNIKQFNYAELPYVARGSLLITLDAPVNRVSIAENAGGHKSSATKPDERPIFAILRALSQIVGTTLRVKQNYNDGSFLLRPIRGDNGENMTEIEVIADNRLCEYDCFDSTTQIANYLAAFQARTNELSHQFGQSSKFALKSIRATEEAESLVGSKYPKGVSEPTSVTTWIMTCVIVIFIGLLLGVLISNKERRVSTGITWFPSNFKLRADDNRSISTYQAAGGDYLRKPLNKLRGNLKQMDRHADGQEMSKAWLQHETIHENKEMTHVIYEEPKDPRSWSVQHYEAYGDGKNKNSTNILMPMPSNLKELLHPGLRQTQNVIMQTEANTEPMANGLLSPPLMNTLNGDVDVVGPSGLTPLMVAAAFRGATPYCGVGDDLNNLNKNETTKLLDNNAIELMDTHNGPGSAGSQTSTNGNSMIDDLISQGANVDKKMENTGETSLHLAARFCRADAVKRLLEAKADCNAQDFKGRTPLHTAIAADACGAFEILIRNRATSLNAKSNDGNTPLILAVRNCADSMMNELLSAGADINATDNAQRTALHWAAMVSNLSGLKALIEHGANKDAQDEKEQTPLFLATREGAYECVQTLLQAGANKDITDHMDVSPRKIAETKKHKDILALLDSEIKTSAQSNAPSNGDQVPASPKKQLNSSNNEPTTNTAKRAKKQSTKQQPAQTQTKFIPQQPLNATELMQQSQMQQTANVQANYMSNATNTGTLKKTQQISSNPNSALNQVPPPLPPPRPQLQPVPVKLQKNQVVNLPPIQTGNPQFEQQLMQQNYNQNLPSPFDHMMHTPLTPTSTTANNPMMNQINHQMPNTPNSITNINSPQMTNHVLLSPNNTVLMSPPHHSNVMNQIMQPAHPYYLGKPPPYESINHCTQQISNATYMTTVTQMQPATQWTGKQQEPNYYTIFNANTNNKNNDASYLTPSPDSPSNWSATTSPASNGDWLELQTPAQQQQMHADNSNNMPLNGANNETLQLALVDQSQLSPAEQQMNHDQMQQQQQQIVNDLNPPTYQASCSQQQLDQQQLEQQQQQLVLLNQQQTANSAGVNANTRQITSTQQAVFL